MTDLQSHNKDNPESERMKSFQDKLELLRILLRRLDPERVLKAMQNAHTETEKYLSAHKRDIVPLRSAVEEALAEFQEFAKLKGLTVSWMSVMLVTFLEAYLEEGIINMAECDPRLVRNAPQVPPSRIMEIETLDELRAETRRNWAQDVLRPNGPQTWVQFFQKMGLSTLERAVRNDLQHLWDTRNLIVHGRGIISVAYATKYQSKGYRAGTKLPVLDDLFIKWLSAVENFVNWVEPFFVSYGGSPQSGSDIHTAP